MNCQRCNSERVIKCETKCNAAICFSLADRNYTEYDLSGFGIKSKTGNYLWIRYCLDCGQLQGKWPLNKTKLEENFKCPDGCGYEGWPEDSNFMYDRRIRYKCPKCGEQRSAEDWGLE